MSYRFIDYNETTTKPADISVFAIYDVPNGELKKMKYSTLKSFFVKTDEATNISANHEIQTSNILYFGSSAESRILFDGTDFILGTTAAASTAKLKLRCNALDFLTLDPVNSSFKCGAKAFNYDGAAGEGLNFDSSNRPVLLSILQMNAGIATKLKNISYNGAAATGLQFDSSSNATFNQNLLVSGTFGSTGAVTHDSTTWMKGNIRIGAAYMSYGGTNAGISLSAANVITMSNGYNADASCFINGGNLVLDTGFLQVNGNYISAFSNISSTSGYISAPNSYTRGKYLIIEDGIAAPGATANLAKIYVDTSDGDLKVVFGNGFIATIAADS